MFQNIPHYITQYGYNDEIFRLSSLVSSLNMSHIYTILYLCLYLYLWFFISVVLIFPTLSHRLTFGKEFLNRGSQHICAIY